MGQTEEHTLRAGLQMATSVSLIDWSVLSREMATSAYGLINGDSCIWFV